MVVVHRDHGFRFVIYTLDHESAHVHVVGAGRAKRGLLLKDGVPELISSVGIKRPTFGDFSPNSLHIEISCWPGGNASMADWIDAQIAAAEERGRECLVRDPRAALARYDQASGRVVIELANGCSYAVPAQLIQDLAGANHADLARVEVDGAGFNLHWPTLDVDLDVPALVAGIFGTRQWMASEGARAAGRKTSPAKAAAARSNGAKGGRPRKAAQA